MVSAAWGVITGDWSIALPVGVFLELFWLDLFPAGTYIPPNAILTLLLTCTVAAQQNLHTPAAIAFPLLLSLPAAFLGSHVEQLLRKRHDSSYNNALHWGRQPNREDTPLKRIVLRSLAVQFCAQFALFIALLLVLDITMALAGSFIAATMHDSRIGWSHLWFLAGVGGVLALRIRAAYVAYGVSATAALVFSLLRPLVW